VERLAERRGGPRSPDKATPAQRATTGRNSLEFKHKKKKRKKARRRKKRLPQKAITEIEPRPGEIRKSGSLEEECKPAGLVCEWQTHKEGGSEKARKNEEAEREMKMCSTAGVYRPSWTGWWSTKCP